MKLANTDAIDGEAGLQFYPLRMRRPVAQWAREERVLASGQSPLSQGNNLPYSFEIAPHLLEPMEAVDDPGVNIIVLWWAKRMFKTEGVCCNVIGRTITDDPGNCYSMWPIEDSSDRFSRDVIEPMIGACPELDRRVVQKKSRDSGRTIDYKRFLGGSLYIVNAGSPSKMRGMAAKVVTCHEIDAFPDCTGKEGDPIEKALGRADGFGNAIKILESTGTLAPTVNEFGKSEYRSNIHYWFERGDQRKWFCPCKECGELQILKFGQIKSLNGRRDLSKYHCELCNYAHTESEWRKMIKLGKWYPTAGLTAQQLLDIARNAKHARGADATVRSYWINGFNSLLPKGKGFKTKLHEFVVEAERSIIKPESKRVWINERCAELYNPDGELRACPPWKVLYDRREAMPSVPNRVLVVTVGIDVQMNRLELFWRGWGRNEESWQLDRVVLPGPVQVDNMQDSVWADCRRELQREFVREDGAKLRLGFGFIDGGHYGDWVLQFLRTRPAEGKLRASKGSSQNPHPIVETKYRKVDKQLHGHHLGVNRAKSLIYARLWMVPSDPPPYGWMHFKFDNERIGEDYFTGLTCEVPRVEFKGAEELEIFDNPTHARNEPLDGEVMALSAFRLKRWELDVLERELAESVKKTEAPDVIAPTVAPRQGFVSPGKKSWW